VKRAAFLDRDGVINRKAPEGQYVIRWDQMEFLPGVCEAVCLLNQSGFVVVVVTNQRCVAKGLITTGKVESMHAQMRHEFETAGAAIDAIYYCPHDIEPPCFCRKPNPGMLLRAAQIHDVDLATSWMIGDSKLDVQAGRTAGCNTALLTEDESVEGRADVLASSLLDAIHKILLASRFSRDCHTDSG
jgi:D-glycero-D-manno-heptose 1,7-bisphosphate phosphatase